MYRKSSIPVVALNPATGQHEHIFLSISDAARHLDVAQSGIGSALFRADRGAHSCCYGYKWRRATTEEIRKHARYKCKHCGEEALSWYDMVPDPNYVSGVRNICKQCKAIKSKALYHRSKKNA